MYHSIMKFSIRHKLDLTNRLTNLVRVSTPSLVGFHKSLAPSFNPSTLAWPSVLYKAMVMSV